jgi:signal transduction histidine kinase
MAATELRTAAPGWTLLLQHQAGSLDAVVAQARRRNLFLSFGILTVLAASAGLVMLNARRSEKLAAQQMDFVATVSHELRTPLAVIRSAAQNLSAGVVHDAGQAKRYGDLIESEGRRLTDMVEQVLEYAGLSDARRRQPVRAVDAASILRDVAAASAALPEAEDVAVDVQIEPDIPPVLADEDAIRRALHNLIGNALKYAGDGGWIGLRVSRGRGADDGFVLVSVADRGRGIPAGDLAHIFEPFYRGRYALDRQIRGNGLGLSLVKRVVESLGGRVSVSSAPDQGSTFTLHLPVASGAAVEAAGESLPSAGMPEHASDSGGRSV